MSRPLGPPAGAPPGPSPGGPGGSKLSQALRNKPLMIAGAVAVGLGGIVFLRRKGKGGSSADSAGSSDGVIGATPGNPAGLTTIGTDVATQLGQYGAAQQAVLQQFLDLVRGSVGAGAIPTGAGGTGVTSPTAGNPFVNPDGTLSVGKGANLYDAARSVGLTGAQFAALNASIWQTNTIWGAGNQPTAKVGRPYKIR